MFWSTRKWPSAQKSKKLRVCQSRRKWQPSPVFLSGEFRGQRSLVGYSPGGCKESDMTEQLSLTHRHVKGKRRQPEKAPKGQSWSKLSNKVSNGYRQTLETLRAWFQTTASKANNTMRKVTQIFGSLMYIKVMFTLHLGSVQ